MAIGTSRAGAPENPFEMKEEERRLRRISEYNQLAPDRDRWRRKNAAYHSAIERLVRSVVPEGASVLEIGCSTGDLLAGLRPAYGVGVDASEQMIDIARKRHSNLECVVGIAEKLNGADLEARTFDYVVLSDVVRRIAGVAAAIRALRHGRYARTPLI